MSDSKNRCLFCFLGGQAGCMATKIRLMSGLNAAKSVITLKNINACLKTNNFFKN